MPDATPSWDNDPLWYKDAIVYQLHVKAFRDNNGDGIGDFRGLTERLEYIQTLGINTVWLLPFYPSPLRDDGYDIAGYRAIHPDYGNRQDFRRFIREAHRRGLKVITELVINHTSDQHPWFQAARRAPKGSAKRDYYVWSDSDQRYSGTRIIFTDTETSNWAWDPVAQQYYWHRFFSHQPDLNFDNPQVRKAVIRTMRFWLDQGVDGLRLDAIPYLCEREGTNNENLSETHEVLKQMRAEVDAHYHGRMFLAEANQWPEDVREYFGDGDECHVAYHFPLMPRMYMALAQEDRHPMVEIMEQTPEIPDNCQWAIFLRNHDELTLEMVTDKERDYMYRTYAADPRMRINVGIRRRLAPLLDNDGDKIRLMHGLLMSMPGTPIVYYGDEIGMGDNIYLGDRNGVRTPMQWSPDRNAGFSRADPQKLFLPPVMDPVYGYESVNVEAQSRSPASLLNWMKRLIAVRKSYQAFGRGRLEFIRPGNRKILAYIRAYQDEVILCVVNLARTAQPVELELGAYTGRVPVELMGRTAFPPIGELPYLLTLPSYGFYWFCLTTEAEQPEWHEERLPPAELPMLVMSDGWNSFFPDRQAGSRQVQSRRLRRRLEQEALPDFLGHQRWFAGKGERLREVRLVEDARWVVDHGRWLLLQLDVELDAVPAQRYFLPLALAWERDGEERIRGLGPAALAKVRQQAQVGVLYDAFAEEDFCRRLVTAMQTNETVPLAGGELRCSATMAFADLAGDDPVGMRVRRPQVGGSNSALILGDRLFLKGYRRLQRGTNPELEIGRFLTEVSPFPNIAPVAGAVELVGDDGDRTTLALLQGYQANQGDAWSYSLHYLRRFLEDSLMQTPDVEPAMAAPHAGFELMIHTLGERTGELHRALAVTCGDPAFDPEPLTPADLDDWFGSVAAEARQTFALLERSRQHLPPAQQTLANRLLARRDEVTVRLAALRPAGALAMVKTRHHGDYHLGQVLIAEADFIIIDFEGEPARPLSERRRKHSALRDVAGMLRSFDYAAYAALLQILDGSPETVRGQLQERALAWRDQIAQAFLAGYQEALADCPVYPSDPDHGRQLIDLFTLEKALYELRYEIDNRPDWAGVPLRGLLAILGQGG